MKIVISGSAGIGKTTLAKKLCEAIKYQYIVDFIDVVMEEKGLESLKNLKKKGSSKEIRIIALDRKIEAENKNKNCISDKGVVDYLAYWLLWSSKEATPEENNDFLTKVKSHLINYDFVIVPKFGAIKMEDNKKREINENYQFMVHCLIKGLYEEFKIKYVEYDPSSSQDIDRIIKKIMAYRGH